MKKIRMIAVLCACAMLSTACAQVEAPVIVDMEDVAASLFGETEENSDKEDKKVAEEASKEDERADANDKADKSDKTDKSDKNDTGKEDGFRFADVKGLKFIYSGAGWRTELEIDQNGKFTGIYQDYDMGKKGDGYEGVVYYSQFTGEFTKPEKVNDTTYSVQVKNVKYPLGQSKKIVNETLYAYSKAPGVDGSKMFYFYLPGTKYGDLPKEYIEYVESVDANLLKKDTIKFYGLYHKGEGEGFIGYEIESDYAKAEEILKEANAAVMTLKTERAKAKTQQEVNMLTYEMYQEWDVALNHVWSILEDTLDEKTYAKVFKEEQEWIEEKRAMKKNVKTKFSGVYMVPYIMYSEAAEMTEERAYELLEYLK